MKMVILFFMLFSNLSSYSNNQILPTKLSIIITDRQGNFIDEAVVTIYENKADYLSGYNAVSSAQTNALGSVIFEDLNLTSYFIEAKKGELNNAAAGVETGVLVEGRINRVNTIIE